ncbi:hypothetical protein Btru_041111 [Bulinus truncatus]|nr:hypothetical protein Btru_041111 [Bulinus truncatus]
MAALSNKLKSPSRLILLGIFIASLELVYSDRANVTFTDKTEIADVVVSLQWRANHESDAKNLFILMLENHCTGYEPNLNFYCENTSHGKTFNFHLNMTAEVALSDAMMMLTVFIGEEQHSSKLVHVPKIYNATSTVLTINEQNFTGDCSSLKYDTNVPQVIRLCCHGTATPCEVIIDHVGVNLVKAKDCVSYTLLPQVGSVELNFSYVVCSQRQLSHSYFCHIQQGSRVTEKEPGTNVVIIVSVILPIMVIVSIGACILYRFKFKGQPNKEWSFESAKSK